MTAEDLQKIKENAELLAEQHVAKRSDRAAYVAEYVGALVKLNLRMERRMARLEDDLTEVIGAMIPTIPGMVSQVAETQAERCHELASAMIRIMSGYAHPGVCALVAEATRDCLGYFKKSLPNDPQ